MFATSSFASKVFTAISVILILAAVILNTDIRLVTMSLYEWVLILVLIFGGAGLPKCCLHQIKTMAIQRKTTSPSMNLRMMQRALMMNSML